LKEGRIPTDVENDLKCFAHGSYDIEKFINKLDDYFSFKIPEHSTPDEYGEKILEKYGVYRSDGRVMNRAIQKLNEIIHAGK